MKFNKYEGTLDATSMKFGIVVSRFNEFLTGKLLDGACDCLLRHKADEKSISVAYVPGAFEIPYAASKMASMKKFDAIICLGAVIRGDTPHFDFIASESSKGIARLGLDKEMPIIYGIVTADTLDQAIERSGTKAGNKGWDAAQTAIEMVSLYKTMEDQ